MRRGKARFAGLVTGCLALTLVVTVTAAFAAPRRQQSDLYAARSEIVDNPPDTFLGVCGALSTR
jgi:hypothetical protein